MSLFHEANELQRFQAATPKFLKPTIEPTNIGHDSKDKEKETTPIFNKRKMLLRIPSNYTGDLVHLTVSNNWLVCLLVTSRDTMMFRFYLPQAIPPAEIALDKYVSGYKITRLFLDQTGQHLLTPLVPKLHGLSADFLYIHGNGSKVRRVEKFKEHEITAVAFNSLMGSKTVTGPILLGTSRGLIFETELTHDTDKPSYKKQIYDLGLGRMKYPITGLELLNVPNTWKFIVIATTPDAIYTFQETLNPEEKSLQAIFAPYVSGNLGPGIEEQKTDFNYSVLRLYALPNEKFPKQWGWLCGAGVRIGEISTTAASAEKILIGDDLISLDFEQNKHLSYEERKQNVPKTFVLTEYHALLLYCDHVTAICLLNQQVVYEEYFHEQIGKLLNIVRDHFTGSIYLYTDKTIFSYKIVDEERNIWRIYLNKGHYDLAEFYAAENTDNLNVVLEKKANEAFAAKNFELAADFYADTCESFEAIALNFMKLDDKRPLIRFMKNRLHKLSGNSEAMYILVVWLTDLFLSQINYPERSQEKRLQWQREFDEFMTDDQVMQYARMHRKEMQEVIAQHADAHNLSQFAIANGDYEEVIKQQLNAEKYSNALKTLTQQKNLELYYKYGPMLMEQLPRETVEVLISQGRKLKIERLVPTWTISDSAQHVNEAMRFLEYVIYNLGESHQAVHNYLIRLYAEHKPDKLIEYLESEGNNLSLVHYDVNYALDVSTEYGVKIACVFLQRLLGMWQLAVELAMTFDEQLAKETASKPEDKDTSRNLWLKIAQRKIIESNDVRKSLSLLEECSLLRIEDLLPFFNDFEKIDEFKEPICKALKEYNDRTSELKIDMDEISKQSDRVHRDLDLILARSMPIEANEACSLCESVLMVKPFFIFVCGHKFHNDCLEKHVMPMLEAEQRQKFATLKQQNETIFTYSAAMAENSYSDRRTRDKIKKEMDEILASDCLFCGHMIDTIDQPFVEDWDQVNEDWD